jgi:nicotinamide mononucleotide adenylyltransferase
MSEEPNYTKQDLLKEERDLIVLFSGKFDPVHDGHFDTITDLGQRVKLVKVIVLKYEEQTWPLAERLHKLRKMLGKAKGNYIVTWHPTHFGRIQARELTNFQPFDAWAGGNIDVMTHLEGLGVRCMYIQRSFDITAGDLRLLKRIKDSM